MKEEVTLRTYHFLCLEFPSFLQHTSAMNSYSFIYTRSWNTYYKPGPVRCTRIENKTSKGPCSHGTDVSPSWASWSVTSSRKLSLIALRKKYTAFLLCSNLLLYMSLCNLVDLFAWLSHLNCEQHEGKECFLFIFVSPVPHIQNVWHIITALDTCLLNGYKNE